MSQCTLRSEALRLLALPDVHHKSAVLVTLVIEDFDVGELDDIKEPDNLPGRAARPALVHPRQLKHRSVHSPQGHTALIHALAHIEANAVNLALDMVWRFSGLDVSFYAQWMQVAKEEAMHFRLLDQHLASLGASYGDLPAHDGLWEMAQRTRADLVARLALVPRTLEARGLDVSPAIREKLASIGDDAGAAILDIILRDEIGHVALGNHWYRQVCSAQGLDPIAGYASLAKAYRAPVLKGPFNLDARRLAGFEDIELVALQG